MRRLACTKLYSCTQQTYMYMYGKASTNGAAGTAMAIPVFVGKNVDVSNLRM